MPKPKAFVLNDDNQQNSYGFYILSSGGRFDRFEANPVMLSNHINTNENVIGQWLNLTIADGKITAEPEFDTATVLGADVSGKVERGFLKGCSMGIIPNWDSLVKVGDRFILQEWELTEASIVPVPSNRGAVAVYSADGKLMKEDDVKTLYLSVTENSKPENFNTTDMKKVMLSLAAFIALGYDTKAIPQDGVEQSEIDAKVLDLSAKLDSVQKEKEALKLANEQLVAAQNEQKNSIATAMVELAVKEGRIGADKKESFIELAKANPDLAKATLEAIPAKINFGAGVTTPTGTAGATEVKTAEDFQKLSLTEQLAFKSDNPEGYKKLFSN